MSAQNNLITAVKAAERGAFEYLPKPFDLKEMILGRRARAVAAGRRRARQRPGTAPTRTSDCR